MELDLTTEPSSPSSADLIQDADTSTFAAAVVHASMEMPIIVDFWATWCEPCKQLTPLLEKIVTQAGGKVKLVKIDVDQNQALAQQLRVQSVPTVMAFKNGQPIDGFMGAQPESQVKAFVERVAGEIGPSPIDQVLDQAQSLLDQGDAQTASQAYMQVLQAEPENAKAIAGLVRCLLAMDDLDGAKDVLASVPDETKDPDLDSARAAVQAADQAASAGDLAPLEDAVAKDPKNHQARFDLALALNGAGRCEEAIDHLINIIRQDRTWNDEAARKQLLTFFDSYGQMDERTLAGRRKLSSLLFS